MSREIKPVSINQLTKNARRKSDNKTGSGKSPDFSPLDKRRRKALDELGKSLEKRILQKTGTQGRTIDADPHKSGEPAGVSSTIKPPGKGKEIDKTPENEVLPSRAGIVSPRSADNEMVASLRMVFYFEPIKDREPAPRNKLESL